MKKSKILVISCIWLVVCFVSLGSFSYAWIKREWNPSVYQNNIQIQTGNALAIQLEDGNTTASVNINDVLGASSSFSLKQVSNLTGWSEDFFELIIPQSLYDATVSHITKGPNDASYTPVGAAHGYIEVRFLLVGASESSQYIFISGDQTDDAGNTVTASYIRMPLAVQQEIDEKLASGDEALIAEAQATKAQYANLFQSLRVSVGVEGIEGSNPNTKEKTFCFFGVTDKNAASVGMEIDKTRMHEAITNECIDGVYTANGEKLFIDREINRNIVKSTGEVAGCTPFVNFSDYFVNTVNKVPEAGSESKYLFTLAGNSARWVVVRIWLEGQDPACVDGSNIAGLKFDFNLQFNSYTPPEEGAQ